MLKEILRLLEEDARRTPEQLSAITGIPVHKVQEEIKKAEEEKLVIKYKTIINWEKAGEEHVRALIEVKVTPQREVGFDTTAQRIARFPLVRSVYLVSGTYDLAVMVEGESIQEIASFVAQKLAPLEFVQGTVTHFLLKRYKEDGEILFGEEELKRLPFVL